MIRLGVIGLNEGNGHPYSYSAMYNGFDPEALQNECPFPVIKEYLSANHRNENLIEGARVTHIWTQDRDISESVARVAKIPNIVENMDDLIGNTDAILLLRDDPANHLAMTKPFLDAGMPVYVDKALAGNKEDLAVFRKYADNGAKMLAGSAARLSNHVSAAKFELDISGVKSVHGIVCNNWLRYASHLLDPIFRIFGYDVVSVRNIGPEVGRETTHIQFASGLEFILQCYKGIGLPMRFTCYSLYPTPHYDVVLTDFYYMYRSLMVEFVKFVNTGKREYSWDETVRVSQVVVAGEISRENGGIEVDPREI